MLSHLSSLALAAFLTASYPPMHSLLTEHTESGTQLRNHKKTMVNQEIINKKVTSCSDLPADILEAVMAKLSTLDVLSASCVSRKWRHAVQSSLHVRPRLFPWLIRRIIPYQASTFYLIRAFDPYSRTWLSAIHPNDPTGNRPLLKPNFLCRTLGDLLYTFPSGEMVISKDPFVSSRQMVAKGPKVWRGDAVVAEIGQWIVVVGGCIMAEIDDGIHEGAVELYDKQTDTWELAEPMPTKFEGSAYATLLSVAVSDKRLYLMEKKTGWISWFDPESKIWGPTCQLRPDPILSNWAIGIAGKEKLLLVGAGSGGGEKSGVMMVITWVAEGDTLQVINEKGEEMLKEMVNHLYPGFESLPNYIQQCCSVEVCSTLHGGYMFDPANKKNGAVMCQLFLEEEKSVGSWEQVSFPATVGFSLMEQISVGCSPVSLHDVAHCLLNQSAHLSNYLSAVSKMIKKLVIEKEEEADRDDEEIIGVRRE